MASFPLLFSAGFIPSCSCCTFVNNQSRNLCAGIVLLTAHHCSTDGNQNFQTGDGLNPELLSAASACSILHIDPFFCGRVDEKLNLLQVVPSTPNVKEKQQFSCCCR